MPGVEPPDPSDDVSRALTAAAEAARRGDLTEVEHCLAVVASRVHELEMQSYRVNRALDRLGDALASTHDRAAIVRTVLESCALSLGAHAAVFYAVGSSGALRATASWAVPEGDRELAEGEGLAGWAAKTGHVVTWPGGAVAPAPAEPVAQGAAAVAVPVRLGTRPFGVVALYGREEPFAPYDIDALETLVHHAETAIENTYLYEEATRLSITDGLTGLWNRRQFELRAGEELQRALRFHEPFGLLMVDIDRFKQVNDRFGHQAGDAALVAVADRLSRATREVDLVARLGGEEFALVLPKTDIVGARHLAAKVRQAVADEPVGCEGKPVRVTVSIGVAACPEHGSTLRALIGRADEALYRAKASGRNRVIAADDAPDAADAAAAVELAER